MSTSLLDSSEGLDIHYTVEVFDHLKSSISSIVPGWTSPPTVLAAIISTFQIQKRRLPTKTPAADMVAQIFRNSLRFFEHLQEIISSNISVSWADDFVRDPGCQWRDASQSSEKFQRNLVTFVLFFEELNGRALSLPLIRQ